MDTPRELLVRERRRRESGARDALVAFHRDLTSCAVPSREENIRLCIAAQCGEPGAMEAFVRANLRLAYTIARRMRWVGGDVLDRVQDGALGLIRAAQTFDPGMGCSVSTYATNWVRAYIQRGGENTRDIVRLPVHVSDKLRAIDAARLELRESLKREPTDEETAAAVAMTAEKLAGWEAVRRRVREIWSLDEPIMGSEVGPGKRTLGDTIPDEAGGPLDGAVRESWAKWVREGLDRLKPRQREAVELRFGFDGEDRSLAEAGATMGVSRERVRQLEVAAIDSFRKQAARAQLWPERVAVGAQRA